jgi:membrane protease YdiL (CAAX protease family)
VEDDIGIVAAGLSGPPFEGLPDDLAESQEGRVVAAKMQGWLRVVVAVLITFGVLSVASVPVILRFDLGILNGAPGLADALLTQIGILVLSLGLISLFTRGKISAYGFVPPTWPHFRRAVGYGIVAALLIQGPITIIGRLASWEVGHPATAGASFLEVVIVIWLIASTCEEILYRGLIQSFLRPLEKVGIAIGRLQLSVPVVVAAVLFGLMHIPLLTLGAETGFVWGVVISAMVLGLVAGSLRQQSGSLVPAVVVHLLFNVVGNLLARLGGS